MSCGCMDCQEYPTCPTSKIDALWDEVQRLKLDPQEREILFKENDRLREALGQSLKAWRHMVNCGAWFDPEWRELFERLWAQQYDAQAEQCPPMPQGEPYSDPGGGLMTASKANPNPSSPADQYVKKQRTAANSATISSEEK